MQKKTGLAVAVAVLVGTMALAHDGVKDPTVKARMDVMAGIGANTKVLGQMAKGEVAFDAARARAAAGAIAEASDEILVFFKEKADDPKSEARDEIWEDFGTFSKQAGALRTAALEAQAHVRAPGDLRMALRKIGSACQACHKSFKE